MLTDVQIRKINLRKGEKLILRDPRTPGLALRACGPIRRTWYVFHRINGKQKRTKLGVYPTMSIADARIAALEIIRTPPSERPSLTFEQLAERFLKEYAYPRLRGARTIEAQLRLHVFPVIGNRHVDEITKADGRELLEGVEKPGAARLVRAWTTRVFSWGMEQDLAERNPFDKIRDLVPSVARSRVLTDKELVSVWRASDASNYPQGPLVQLLILTGARRGELMNARWDWLHGDTIEVPASHYKTKTAHLVVLSDLARDIIEQMPRVGDWMFSISGEGPMGNISKVKRRLDKASKVKDWRLHDLRRTAATGMARLGVDPVVIESVLGHKLVGIAGVYNRYSYLDQRRDAVKAWADHVEGLIGPVDAASATTSAQLPATTKR